MSVCYVIIYLFFLYVPIKRALHMYQQNRYRFDRYSAWLMSTIKRSSKAILQIFLILCLCYGLLLVDYEAVPQVLLALLVIIFAYLNDKVEEEKRYRKPLQMTARVRRLWVIMLLLHGIVLFVFFQYSEVTSWIVVTPFLYFLPWVFIILAGILAQPVERAIQNSYVKDAKHILKRYPELTSIGITGSFGKTSVKNILNHFLSERWMTLMTPQSYNNRMGITITIRKQLKALHEMFICEMGADHVHDIEELMDFVEPSIGIVTAVGPQHLQTFHSIDNILHEKMQMIEKLPVHGIGFLNADNEYIRSYSLGNVCPIVWFGKDYLADYRYDSIEYQKDGTHFTIAYKNELHAFHTVLLGEHNVINITAAIAVAHTLGLDFALLKKSVETLPYVTHRLEKIQTATYTILDDAYNSNPAGARFALDVLSKMPGKRIIVTPGMIDLGKEQEKENYTFGCAIANHVDEVILVGQKQTTAIYKGLLAQHFAVDKIHVFNDIQQAFDLLKVIADADTTVLLENDLPDAFNY